YKLCANAYDVLSALADVSRYPHVMLDCEGRVLGKVGGALSLLCLGTPEPGPEQRIYAVDVPGIRYLPTAHAAVADFLARRDIAKVVWDGRMDYIELCEVFGVEPASFLDLQVAEVLARANVLGEVGQERLARLHRLFGDIELDPVLFAGIHVVLGMQAAMQMYAPSIPMHKDPVVEGIHKKRQSHLWLVRPVPFALLHYAAVDIRLLAHLF
ncbi:ribonuclease H-like domain-containing protein, partial [Vararia minispora EC-137]